jgi:hypothetical protein
MKNVASSVFPDHPGRRLSQPLLKNFSQPPRTPVRKPERDGEDFNKWLTPWVTGLNNTKIVKNLEKRPGEVEIRSINWQNNFDASFLPMLPRLLDQFASKYQKELVA